MPEVWKENIIPQLKMLHKIIINFTVQYNMDKMSSLHCNTQIILDYCKLLQNIVHHIIIHLLYATTSVPYNKNITLLWFSSSSSDQLKMNVSTVKLSRDMSPKYYPSFRHKCPELRVVSSDVAVLLSVTCKTQIWRNPGQKVLFC